MNKFKSFMEKLKKNIFIYIVVWLLLAILLVAPFTYTLTQGKLNKISWLEALTLNFVDNFFQFPIRFIFEEPYLNGFIEGLKYYSIVFAIIVYIAIKKTLPKGAYDKIEHGSSDWCAPGEQYKILNKKEGLLLAKDNYLPLNKTGNVNVLIVGRFRCW